MCRAVSQDGAAARCTAREEELSSKLCGKEGMQKLADDEASTVGIRQSVEIDAEESCCLRWLSREANRELGCHGR